MSTIFKCMMRFTLLLILFTFGSCTDSNSIKTGDHFSLVESVAVKDNKFKKRVFQNDLYEITVKAIIPDYVGNIYQIKANPDGIYFNDPQSIYRYSDGEFEIIYTPSKGRGPDEVQQIFRFDIREDDVIAIAGYPDMRLLLHQLSTDTTALIMTEYRGNVLIDRYINTYGGYSDHRSSYMITKFDADGDSLKSFARIFNNQDQSLTMFNFYWDYNEKNDLIIVGFMYAGYIAAFDINGNVVYIIENIQYPGHMPIMVKRGNMQYADDEIIVLRHLTTKNDEIHIYTANVKNRRDEVYGALIDVFDVSSGSYRYSYILEEPLHWPIELLDDYSLVSVTKDYELVIWQRSLK